MAAKSPNAGAPTVPEHPREFNAPVRGYIPTLRKAGKLNHPDFLYIGRRWTLGPYNLKASVWQNPFTTRVHGLDRSLELYERHVRSHERLLDRLPELEGKTLGCWCKPHERCHADVLIRLFEERSCG
jgi:hypothetical protein